MDSHVIEYYSVYNEEHPHGHFHRVIALHEEPLLNWKEASELAPELCRGWYELMQLSVSDRIEFVHDFWLASLPYHRDLVSFIDKFFSNLDDIGIFLTQKKFDDPFQVHFVYSLINNSGFFKGNPQMTDEKMIALQKQFLDYTFPLDYLAFLRIHDGFAKQDDTGIIASHMMHEVYQTFQSMIRNDDGLVMDIAIDPKTLIPFYQSFGLPFFQCFWAEWYPEQEMGNVYYSGSTKSISICQKGEGIETMAFKTFADWLIFYLEKID